MTGDCKIVKKIVYAEIGQDEVELDFTFEVEISDYLYGADADGNRGEWRTEITEWTIQEVYGHNYLGEEIDLSKEPYKALVETEAQRVIDNLTFDDFGFEDEEEPDLGDY